MGKLHHNGVVGACMDCYHVLARYDLQPPSPNYLGHQMWDQTLFFSMIIT